MQINIQKVNPCFIGPSNANSVHFVLMHQMIHFQTVRGDACEFLALLVCTAQHVASLLDCSKIVTIVQNAPQHGSGENQATIRSLVANSMSGRLCPILNLPRRGRCRCGPAESDASFHFLI